MPIIVEIDPARRHVTATATGQITREDLEAYLRIVAGADAYDYAKLFDGSAATSIMDEADLLHIGVGVRDVALSRVVGPLAIVLPEDVGKAAVRLLGILAAAKRPMGVFRKVPPARRWLARQVDGN
jgi:hypothetical protein